MPTRLSVAFALTTIVILAACTGPAATPSGAGSASAPGSTTDVSPSGAASPSDAASPSGASASPSDSACALDSLQTKTAGKLTVGADNPAYPPYFEPRDGGNSEPWDPDGGDPTTGEGFESAVAYAVAGELGFSPEDVSWIAVPFANSYAPGPKQFDIYLAQVSYSAEREQGVDLSDGYYFVKQAVIVPENGEFADATTIAQLKDARFGAQTATTSLRAIQEVIQPTQEPQVYEQNADAIQALGVQIDALVVDLPTSFYITNVQTEGNKVVGQMEPPPGADPEYFSLVLEKDSPLTDCVNEAIRTLADDGTLESLVNEWLSDQTVPVLEP